MRLPAGFSHGHPVVAGNAGLERAVAHLVFTDGVASVSVFVEPRRPEYPACRRPGAVGSSSAFSTVVDGHQVTAVGEVPPTTVEFIANQVKAPSRRRRTQGLGLAPTPPRRK